MAKRKNKNIVPLKSMDDLKNECDYKDFEYRQYFHLLCKLLPFEIFGQHFEDSYPPNKKAENIIINDFIDKHGKKPIGCTQT